jgi:HNH endonuclease
MIYDMTSDYRTRPEHIVVFETANHCCMLPWGVVHHRDFDKHNNHVNNLRGMTRSAHSAYHQRIEKYLHEVSQRILEKALTRMRRYRERLPFDISKEEHILYWDPTRVFHEWFHENIEDITKEFELELIIATSQGLGITVNYSTSSLKVTSVEPNTEP